MCRAWLRDVPVAKCACVPSDLVADARLSSNARKQRLERAAEYLETEAQVHRLLNERAPRHSIATAHSAHLAPYLGWCVKDGCRYLLWREAGEETLEAYLANGGQRLPELAKALACEARDVPHRVVRHLMRALAHIHACGIAHRDIKPANLLVDAKAHTLRLIDFGSAADCSGWLDAQRRGLRADRISASPRIMTTSKIEPDPDPTPTLTSKSAVRANVEAGEPPYRRACVPLRSL